MKRMALIVIVASVVQWGCDAKVLGGAAVGAAGAGAAYEIQNKRQMDRLNDEYTAGRIDQNEYQTRKQQIEKGSIIY